MRMQSRIRIFLFSGLLIVTLAVATTVRAGHDEHDDHGGDDHAEEAIPTGPHGGRLVGDAALQAEVTIFETGVAPQMRVWFTRNGAAVDPASVAASVTLRRLGRAPEKIAFQPLGDFLLGDRVVEEPHSFRVDVEASHAGRTLKDGYETLEARVTIPVEVAEASGVASEVAGPRDLERSLRLTGRIGLAPERMADLKPRFAGVVVEARGTIGDRVARGATLATVEGNASLSRYTLSSPLAGVLLDRRAVEGASVSESDTLYTVADLSRVQADLDVYGQDALLVRVGEQVTVRDDAHAVEERTPVTYVSPLRDVHTQTTLARAELDNTDGRWAPGAFVSATIALQEAPAAITVPTSALQTWRGREAVFVHAESIWEARPVRLGRRGERWVEVLDGLEAGTVVATGNTFLLRAEIEKAGASHDH
jgi:cobalt-zinc-cadmium efflux system membrane fusion protein